MPDGADKSITLPSNQFKKSTYKVIAAIALFVVVYILLLISATAIAAALGWLGVTMMAAVHNFIVLVLGIGLILSGLMLIFPLIKFIFTKARKKIPG
jgi:small neutral amino acid transporter SnatA (MarC family)